MPFYSHFHFLYSSTAGALTLLSQNPSWDFLADPLLPFSGILLWVLLHPCSWTDWGSGLKVLSACLLVLSLSMYMHPRMKTRGEKKAPYSSSQFTTNLGALKLPGDRINEAMFLIWLVINLPESRWYVWKYRLLILNIQPPKGQLACLIIEDYPPGFTS